MSIEDRVSALEFVIAHLTVEIQGRLGIAIPEAPAPAAPTVEQPEAPAV